MCFICVPPAALERQCDEHRKRAKELKSKSQHLNNVLMNLTPVATPPAPKRPRLTRAVSGPASVMAASAQPAQFTLPITQLTGIPLDKILSACSAPNQSPFIGSYTVLTSPGGGAELQADASNLTVLSSDTIVKVLSPIQLVTLPTLGPAASLQSLAAPAGGSTVISLPVSAATVETLGAQAEEGTAEQQSKDRH